MSVEFSFEIQAPSDHQVTICLSGELTAHRVSEVEPDVRKLVDSGEPLRILWDMRAVRRCDLGARRVLQKIQRAIGTKQHRTAYLASRPRIRGVALWVVHTSRDELARPFASHTDAMDWLDLDIGRMEQNQRVARTLIMAHGGRARS